MLDYDGILTEIVKSSDDAFPSDEINEVLNIVVELENTTVVIATGRSKEDADKWFRNENIHLYAEHSAYSRINNKWKRRNIDLSWKESAREIINEFVSVTPNTKLDEKNTSLLFHYSQADLCYAEEQAERCRQMLIQTLKDKTNVKKGKCIVEVNCLDIGKDYVIKHYKAFDFGFCGGDDITDENMFGLVYFISVVVGNKISKAEYYVNDPKEMRNLKKNCVLRINKIPL